MGRGEEMHTWPAVSSLPIWDLGKATVKGDLGREERDWGRETMIQVHLRKEAVLPGHSETRTPARVRRPH